ncbi:MAG: ABC transporter substrate-binding protein [Candidatus Promineifilaceae bacterium]
MKRMTLFIVLVLAIGAILAACQSSEPEFVEVTRIVTETETVEGETVEVTRIVEGETQTVEVTRVVTEEVVAEPEAEPVDRNGGWLDTIVIIEEPDANSAVARLEASDLDVYADDVGGEPALQAIASDAIETRTQYGLFDELTFNLAACQDESVLNPFTNQTIREAMNYAIDRDYVAQELYNGLAVPKYQTLVEAGADRARFAKEIRQIEAEYAYDFDRAQETITAEMEGMGAELTDGVWTYNGEPINLIFLIRNEDTRLLIGNYIANQLEEMGFQVERVERTSGELSPIWISGDPSLCEWNLYTGAWSQNNVDRESTYAFEQYYTDRVLAWPLFALYDPPEVLDEAALRVFNSDFSSIEERAEVIREALPLTMQYAPRDWITSRTTVVPFRNEVEVTTDLAAGISGFPFWAKTIRFEDEVGGSMTIGLPSVFTEPWNPWGGSNWVFDQMVIRGLADGGVYSDPYTGLGIPDRIERAEVVVEEGYPMSASSDWVSLSFEPEVVVPDDAWAGWDAANQVFLTAADVYTETQTALLKSTVYYPEDLFQTVTWHDGSPFSVADVVMLMITTLDLGNPDSPYYDEALVPGLEQFQAAFKGFRIASTDPLVIEYWADGASLDAENAVISWWPAPIAGVGAYPYTDAAWHNMALMLRGTGADSFEFTDETATANEVDRINMIAGPSLEIFATELAAAEEEGFIPYAPTLGQYITAEEATARYENLAEFARRYGHYYISTGPYFLSGVFPVEGQAVLSNYLAYPDPADRWSRFSAPAFPEVEIDGPARVTIGDEAAFDIYVDVFDGPYPVADISSISYLVYDANGELAAEGAAEAVEDGLWEIVLSSDVTAELPEGSSRLDVVIVSNLVAIPRLASFEFVTAP